MSTRMTNMEDGILLCTNCKKEWSVSGSFTIENANGWWNMHGAQRGKLHKTTCTKCQQLSPATH